MLFDSLGKLLIVDSLVHLDWLLVFFVLSAAIKLCRGGQSCNFCHDCNYCKLAIQLSLEIELQDQGCTQGIFSVCELRGRGDLNNRLTKRAHGLGINEFTTYRAIE